MKSKTRATPNGQTLLAQGEPMVWMSGGMFAIACSMIAALIGFIVWQGLATHWQRPVLLVALNEGEILSGELQNELPFALNPQSIADLDATSQLKAEALVSAGQSKNATQWYIRTGNYDVGNKHFTFVPKVKLASDTASFPKDLWLLERREWGVLYGFPRRLRTVYTADQDAVYQLLSNFLQQCDQWSDGIEPDSVNAFKNRATEHLKQFATKLESDQKEIDRSTDDRNLIRSATQASMLSMRQSLHAIQAAKGELGMTDRQLSNLRLEIRKAELNDKTVLQTIAEDLFQNAEMMGALQAQSIEASTAIDAWEKFVAEDAAGLACIRSMRENAKKQSFAALQEIQQSIDALKDEIASLPFRSQTALKRADMESRLLSQHQYEINQRIALLEEILRSHVLEMQLPITELLGQASDTAGDISDPKTWDDRLKKMLDIDLVSTPSTELTTVKLSDRHTLLNVGTPGKTSDRFLAVQSSDTASIALHKFTIKEVLVSDIVRIAEPNGLGWFGKLGLYATRWTEFLFGEPREAGIEGGFFPAIWGTVVMTLIMSIAVMPFGVMAALYMKEYAKAGWVLSLIRISINNLAGVPSIVYGVFGLAFFCYTIGGYIDGGPKRAGFAPWPSSTWFAALGVTAFSGFIAFYLSFLGSGSPAHMTKGRKRLARFSGLFWLLSLLCLIAIIAKAPYFHGFYEASLPNPTFGKGCLLWASLTLALLTLPVVIVATEEALAAVPNSLREGSYACGAGKWQTLQRIVLPYAKPGIITGFILAMARGAGEVAPMMLVGAIPLATDLPLDFEFPFFHGSRSFMHLGFQIYSLGFQSQNSEAAKPMVFTATLLLLTIVTLLNVVAIWLRANLRKRFQGSQF